MRPWDTAGVSLEEWRMALGQSVREMTRADTEISGYVRGGHARPLSEWRKLGRAVRTTHERHLRLFQGDRSTVLRLIGRAKRRGK